MPLNACPNLGCSVARRRNVPRVHHAEGYIERPACQLKGLRPMREERAVTGKQRACVLKAITRDFAKGLRCGGIRLIRPQSAPVMSRWRARVPSIMPGWCSKVLFGAYRMPGNRSSKIAQARFCSSREMPAPGQTLGPAENTK